MREAAPAAEVHRADVVVIGAGQAGLSAAFFLRRSGYPNWRRGAESGFLVLDHAARPGGAWQYRWPTLSLDRVHGLYDLPGMAFGEPDGRRPAAEVVPEYFGRFERTFDLPVLRPAEVRAVRDAGREPGGAVTAGRLIVESDAGSWAARAVVNATGTWDRPFWPRYPGQESFTGRQLHTAGYPGPGEFRGRRVVVVGGGTSAVQLLIEIASVAAETTWVTRRPPVFREGPFTAELGRAAVARVDEAVRAGRPPDSVVGVTGLMLTPEVREARDRGILDRLPMFERITPRGVAWADGTERRADVILWATGFRAAIDHLAPLHVREPGGGIVMDGTRVVADPRLHLVGYGPSASTVGANRAGRGAVREIRELLARVPSGL
ncbi:pyridine nucleotide-disulfide oxidoreductase [Amycolatopsis antarctica]|uniref:Pyridine nucleotide-disulfide oxidoreductase n=1 Tax=Amycolatopsis antarctica TaxID=1854586 RepID=A0A263CVF6_9PSEU|nr:FAD-dependent oxidoreductase [Amycolatopsis antarctica]OZM70103.1 pyridine nucleotide-disulfide oxidoreductase [Amycolatopsis antarctica]